MLGVLFHGIDAAAAANPDLVRVAYLRFWMFSQSGHLTLQFIGKPFVIGVEEGEPLPRCFTNASVAGSADTAIRLVESDDFWIIRLNQVGRVIGGAVVHDDNFLRPLCLIQDGIESAGEEVGTVVSGDDDGNR